MLDEIWHQFGIKNYNGNVLSVYSVRLTIMRQPSPAKIVHILRCYTHRVDREDITIIIFDTKLVPDFVLHACCFFIAGHRPVLMQLNRTNKSLTYENRAAKS